MKLNLITGALATGFAMLLPAIAQDDAPKPAPAEATAAPDATAEAGTAAETPTAPIDPAQAKKNSSYGLGFRTGGEFNQRYGSFGIKADDLDLETFFKGFADAMKGSNPKFTDDELNKAMQSFGEMLQEREKQLAEENLKKGSEFLAENKERDGVKTTESGLQYEVLEAGGDEKYAAPKEGEPAKQFMVNYRGTLVDGTEFDKSPEGEPVPMTLEVIEGFKEALTTMPVGAKWKLFIPSELAYGEQRRSAELGPNSVLIFELELASIEEAAQAPGGMPFPIPQGE